MRAKKERCVMLGAWIVGEMGLAKEGIGLEVREREKERRQNPAAREDTCGERRLHSKELKEGQGSLNSESQEQ